MEIDQKILKEEKINEFKEKLFDLVEEYHHFFCHNDEFFNGVREVEKQANIEKKQHLSR
jgi:Zn-dependent peptidase ImmA (M78 family)